MLLVFVVYKTNDMKYGHVHVVSCLFVNKTAWPSVNKLKLSFRKGERRKGKQCDMCATVVLFQALMGDGFTLIRAVVCL